MEEEKKTAAETAAEQTEEPKRRKRTRKKKAAAIDNPAAEPEAAPDKAAPAEEPPAAPAAKEPAPQEPDEKPESPESAESAQETAETEPAQPAEAAAAPESAQPAKGSESAPPPAEEEPAPVSAPAGNTADDTDPAELAEYEFSADEDTDEEENTPEKRERAANISRTAQLSIAQIMEALPEDTEPAPSAPEPPAPPVSDDTDDSDDEPEDTIPQKLGRGVFGMFKWLLLVVLFVLIIACGGVAWLYRSATPDMLPEIKVTFDGQEVSPTAYSWHVPVVGSWFKRTYAETISSTPIVLDTPVSGASPDLVITPSGYSSTLTITDAQDQAVYDGSATGFRSYLFDENGTFDAKLVVKAQENSDTANVTGTETWQFRFTVSIKPSVQLATASVQQGSVAAVRVGATLGGEAPTIETSLKNVGFVEAANGWICYLPIPWNQPAGDVDLTVTADGYTEKLTLSVRGASYTYKDYSRTSQMTSPYIGENDAPEAVRKLFTTVDDTIQWAVGGFVQPFLDSFDTPLLYGTTEYAGRSYSERSTNYGYGGRTSTNVVTTPKKSNDSMIVPASGRVLLAEDLGSNYGNTVVIEHGAGLKSIFYGLGALNVKAGDRVKQGQLLGVCSKTVVAEMRIGSVPINPLLVWRGQCDGLKNY